jgi:hypothetical protein
MIRWIILSAFPYEGYDLPGAQGIEEDPIPSFATREEADEYADKRRLVSKKYREILAVKVP